MRRSRLGPLVAHEVKVVAEAEDFCAEAAVQSCATSGRLSIRPVGNPGRVEALRAPSLLSVVAVLALGGSRSMTLPQRPAVPSSAVPSGSLIAFPTRTVGYFVTDRGGIRRTRDGGRTWRAVGSVSRPLVAVDFVSPADGFGLSRRGALWATRDGGRRWEIVHRFIPAPGELNGPAPAMTVDFVDRAVGYVASGPSRVFRTRDGGRSWRRLSFGCPDDHYLGGLAFANRRRGFAVCGGQPATAMQYREYHFTSDGGDTWRHDKARVFDGHIALAAFPAVGVRYIYASRWGISRLAGQLLLNTDDADSVLAMSWPTPAVGYALLLHGGLRRTLDRGNHWRRH